MRPIHSKSIAFAVIATVIVTSCSSAEDSSRRSLNSVTCFESVEAKEAARLEAQRAYEQTIPTTTVPVVTLNTPELFDASGEPAVLQSADGSSNLVGGGYRVPAYIRATDDSSTTSTTTDSPSSTVAPTTSSSTPTTANTEEDSPTTTDEDVTTNSVESETTTTSVESETPTTDAPPVISSGDDPREAALAALQALIEVPICSEIENVNEDPSLNEEDGSDEFGDEQDQARECEVSVVFNADGTATIDICDAADWFSATGKFTMSLPWMGVPLTVPAGGAGFELTAYVGNVIVFAQQIDPPGPFETSSTYYVSGDGHGNEVPVTVAQQSEDGETCSIDTNNGNVSVNCEEFVYAYFITVSPDGEGRTMAGVSSSLFSQAGAQSMSMRVWTMSNVIVFDQEISPDNIYEFFVPIDDAEPQEEGGDQSDELFGGIISPAVDTKFSASLESDGEMFMQFYASCDQQEISATLTNKSTLLVETLQVMPSNVLNEGLCGVWIYGGATAGDYEVEIQATTDHFINWNSNVNLTAVSGSGSLEFEMTGMPVTASQQYSITLQNGGWVRIQGNSNSECGPDVVDPYLLILDTDGREMARDDDGASTQSNCNSAVITVYLSAGKTYTIVATTIDIAYAEDLAEENATRTNAPVDYVLLVGSPVVTNENQIVADSPPVGVEIGPGEPIADSTVSSVANQLPNQGVASASPLPTASLTSSDLAAEIPATVISADVTTMVCSRTCIDNLFEIAEIQDGFLTISIGGSEVVVSRSDQLVKIPLSSGRQVLKVVGKSADGATSKSYSAPIVRVTPRFAAPAKTGPTPLYPAKSGQSERLPLSWPWVATVLIALIGVGTLLKRRATTR